MHEFLGAKLIHLIFRGEKVIGRYGRRGSVTGILEDHVLTATLHDSTRNGELTVTFTPDFCSFNGAYVTGSSAEAQRHECSGERLRR